MKDDSLPVAVLWFVMLCKRTFERNHMRKLAIGFAALTTLAIIGTVGSRTSTASSSDSNAAQDAAYLDRRISMLETRLYSIESSLRTLEQQAMQARSAPSQPARDAE